MRTTILLVSAVLSLGGCASGECTAMGCAQGVSLELASPLAEEGEYTFTLAIGSDFTTCSAFIPMRRDGSEPTCEAMAIHRQEVTTKTNDGVTAGDDIVSIWVEGIHDALTLTVSHDGADTLQAHVTPVYRGVEINGEGCGECLMATHAVGD